MGSTVLPLLHNFVQNSETQTNMFSETQFIPSIRVGRIFEKNKTFPGPKREGKLES